MTETSNSPPLAEVEMMLRITANLVAHGQHHLLPLLQRLERDHAEAQKQDPGAYAKQLLQRMRG